MYMGNGWSTDFSKTHFDAFSPPDFYTKVSSIFLLVLQIRVCNLSVDGHFTMILFLLLIVFQY